MFGMTSARNATGLRLLVQNCVNFCIWGHCLISGQDGAIVFVFGAPRGKVPPLSGRHVDMSESIANVTSSPHLPSFDVQSAVLQSTQDRSNFGIWSPKSYAMIQTGR